MNVGNVQTIASSLLAVDIHGEHRKPRRLLNLHLRGALNLLQHCGDFFCGLVQDIHVVTEDLHGYVTAHPGDQLVKAQLNGLGELIVVARDFPDDFLNRRE